MIVLLLLLYNDVLRGDACQAVGRRNGFVYDYYNEEPDGNLIYVRCIDLNRLVSIMFYGILNDKINDELNSTPASPLRYWTG